MTLIKRRKRQKFVYCFSHAKISWHHYYVIIVWQSVMMTRNFSMRKYSKRIFCRFLRFISVIVTLVLERQFFALIFAVFITVFFRSGLISFNNSTQKTYWTKGSRWSPMLPILCQISLPWQRGLIARPNNPLLGARILMIFPIQIEL